MFYLNFVFFRSSSSSLLINYSFSHSLSLVSLKGSSTISWLVFAARGSISGGGSSSSTLSLLDLVSSIIVFLTIIVLGLLIVLPGHGLWLVLDLIGDLFLNVEVFGEHDALARLLHLLGIDLDDADDWLSIDLGVVVHDHVDPIVDGAHTVALQCVHVLQLVLLQLDVL